MRAPLSLAAILALGACGGAPPPPVDIPGPPPQAMVPPPPPASGDEVEQLATDSAETTAFGNTFTAPAGWTVARKGDATILTAPEGTSHIALVDVHADDAEAALAAAWKLYKPDASWKIQMHADAGDRDGWSKRRAFAYEVSPNEKRDVNVDVRFANGAWLVTILDLDQAVEEKRLAQLALITGHLLPKGYARESFAGKTAATLDAAHIAKLAAFVTAAEQAMGVPGVAFGLVQHGKVVFSGGIGVRELGKPATVDGNTAFMIASNTKQLTTLMLAKLVDAKKLTWETPVTSLVPTFKLGTDDITRQVLVKHLICACTGLPRQDLEWIFEFANRTPEDAMGWLAHVQPTTGFGETFQYSNLLAAAGGYVGGHVAFPGLELGRAYDRAMQQLVFDPLHMSATTFDYARAQKGNHASAHAPDITNTPAHALMALNYAVIPVRPAGAAWSTVNDLLKYVTMELAKGKVAGRARYIGEEPLLARRIPQVPIGKDTTYGMGLEVDTAYGVPVVHHGGDVFGYHSDVIWLPDSDVGAVILTNGDGGTQIYSRFRRKLLEVLFDGNPEADAAIAADGQEQAAGFEALRKQLVIPASPDLKLAAHYTSDSLGDIEVTHPDGKTVFDFGEFKSEVASRKNPDGTTSVVTLAPGFIGFEAVISGGNLVARDAQHEYVFKPKS